MAIFYRLLGFLRPYKRGVVVSWILASFAMAMSVILPLLTGEAVETINSGARHARRHELVQRSHDRHTLLLYALAIIAVVLARWGFTYWRRMIAGRVSRSASNTTCASVSTTSCNGWSWVSSTTSRPAS